MKERLRVLFCDHLNLARGKYLPGKYPSGGESRFCQGIYALSYDKDLLPAPCSKLLDGLSDMTARFDGSDIRPSWHNNVSIVVADQLDNEGNSLAVCGRTLLKRSVAQWAELGYLPKVGIELEAYAFVRDPAGNLQAYETPGAYVYSTGPFADPLEFTDLIYEKSEQCGFNLEMITSEFDSPQFEFTLNYDDALKAADEVFLFRFMAREIAFQKDVLLTFMPKPIMELSGSGVHVNFSLWDNNGVNAIGDISADDKLSPLGRTCVAGLMHHHQGLSALLAPTANSYDRLKPASLSGYWRNWGLDHRGVTARIASEAGQHARIEHRMADGASNPYTMIASVLQAARLGYLNNYKLPPAETADCLLNQDAKDGVPENLFFAIQALKDDQALVESVGKELVDNLTFIKEDEFVKTTDLNNDQLRDFYIHYI